MGVLEDLIKERTLQEMQSLITTQEPIPQGQMPPPGLQGNTLQGIQELLYAQRYQDMPGINPNDPQYWDVPGPSMEPGSLYNAMTTPPTLEGTVKTLGGIAETGVDVANSIFGLDASRALYEAWRQGNPEAMVWPGIDLAMTGPPGGDDLAKLLGITFPMMRKIGDPKNEKGLADWFAKSKVQKKGIPKQVYQWETGELGQRPGSMATSNVSGLGSWFNDRDISSKIGADRAYPSILSLQNPKAYKTLDDIIADAGKYESPEEFKNDLIRRGHDGVVVRKDTEFGGTSYVAFRPNQIRSSLDPNVSFSQEEVSHLGPMLWGETEPKTMDYLYKDLYPDITRKDTGLKAAKKTLVSPMVDNPIHREIAAFYREKDVPIEDIEQYYMNTLNKDPDGKSVFTRIYEKASRDREVPLTNLPYSETRVNISKGAANEKAEGEYIPLDTSRGCLNNCNECYACGLAKKSNLDFTKPTKVELIGNFQDDPTKIRRIGTSGEPSWDPIKEDYNWAWTNEQVKNTGLATPEGQKKTFIITKLNTVEGFDPSIIRNLEVSVDPMNPQHFFQTMKNLDKLRELDPTLNVMMRIRSVSTASDEINALQQIAVDYANKTRTPVLETRMRFKSGEGLENILPNRDYVGIGNQQKDTSYRASPEPKWGLPEKERGKATIHFEDHTATETHRLNTSIQADLIDGKIPDNDKLPVWSVHSDGEVIQSGLTKPEAVELGKEWAAKDPNSIRPTAGEVKTATMKTSPLSQFGLDPSLQYNCNVANLGGGACAGCQNCRAFLKLGERRAEKAALSAPGVAGMVPRGSGF